LLRSSAQNVYLFRRGTSRRSLWTTNVVVLVRYPLLTTCPHVWSTRLTEKKITYLAPEPFFWTTLFSMPQKRRFDAPAGGVSKAARPLVLSPPNHPAGVAYYLEGRVVWTEFAGHKVHCTVGPIACEHPRGVAVRGKQCAVTGANGLVVYDLQTGKVERAFPQLRGAYDVAFTPDGRGVYVTGNNALTLVNLADGACTTVGGKLLDTRGVAVSADGRFAFVSLGLGNYRQLQVVRVDLRNGKVSWPFKKCRGIGPVTGISLLGNYLYVVGPDCREVCRVDLRVPGERVTVYEASHGFYGVAVSPYGHCVVVTKWGANGRVIEIDVTPEPVHQRAHEASEDAGSSAAPASGSSAAPASGSSAAPASGSSAAPASGSSAAPASGSSAAPASGSSAAPASGFSAAPGTGSGVAPGAGHVPAPVAAPFAAPGTGSSAAPGSGSGAAPGAGLVTAPSTGPGVGLVAAPSTGPGAGPAAGPVAGPVAVSGAGHDAVAARQAKLLTMQLNAASTAFWHAVKLEQLASDSYGVGSPLHTEAKEQMQLAEAWVKELLPKFPRPWPHSVDGDCP
jgi:hypothetical protein